MGLIDVYRECERGTARERDREREGERERATGSVPIIVDLASMAGLPNSVRPERCTVRRLTDGHGDRTKSIQKVRHVRGSGIETWRSIISYFQEPGHDFVDFWGRDGQLPPQNPSALVGGEAPDLR